MCRAGMKSTNTSPPSFPPQSSLGYVLSREMVPLTVTRGVPGLPSLQIQPVLRHGCHTHCALEDCLGPAGVPLLAGSSATPNLSQARARGAEGQQHSITWELVEMQDLGPHPRWGFPPQKLFSQDLQVIRVHHTS